MSHYKTIQALGTPIVLHSGITKMLGSITASCSLSHIMYWRTRRITLLAFIVRLMNCMQKQALPKVSYVLPAKSL